MRNAQLLNAWHNLQATAQQLLFSRTHSYVYALLIVLNGFLFCWTIGKYHIRFSGHQSDDDAWYVALDICATLLLFYEVGVRIIANPHVRSFGRFHSESTHVFSLELYLDML